MKAIDIISPLEQEGTKTVLAGWLIAAGDAIKEGEPLVELETEKVSVEVAAPATGILDKILVEPETEVLPGTVLGRLRQESVGEEPPDADSGADSTGPADNTAVEELKSNGREHRLSPSVRRLVREHDLDPTLIDGTGKSNRVTRRDVEAYLNRRAAGKAPPTKDKKSKPTAVQSIDGVQSVPHSPMRRRIAEHMSRSVATAPHVTAVFEADLTNVMRHRAAMKSQYASKGVNLSFTTYFISACVDAMRAVPSVNSRWHDDYLEIFDDINIGVGVSLEDKGLIVPVIRQAQSLSHFGIAEALHRVTEKARAGQLSPADVQGGTFTISNHGTSGSLLATPIIINQPQSAILGVGKLEKRVVVRSVDGHDTMQIRPLAYVSLTIDHRVLDGAQTNAWLSAFVGSLEQWPAR